MTALQDPKVVPLSSTSVKDRSLTENIISQTIGVNSNGSIEAFSIKDAHQYRYVITALESKLQKAVESLQVRYFFS